VLLISYGARIDARDPFGISVIIFFPAAHRPGHIVDILFALAGYVDPADKANLERETRARSIDRRAISALDRRTAARRSRYSYVSEKPALDEILREFRSRRGWRVLALLFSHRSPFRWRHQRGQSGHPLDYILRVVSLSGLSLPSFWLGC